MTNKHGLGKGLSSLIPQKSRKTENSDKTHNAYTKTDAKSIQPEKNVSKKESLEVIGVEIEKIKPNKQQPRMYFDEKPLRELADSIKEHGVLQPLIVIETQEGYELVAGERRLRASKMAGLKKVPVIVREGIKEQKKLELAIIENVQRDDLNIIEEAKSYKKLADEFGLSQQEIAQKTGKSRSAVANRMRLTQLPVEIQRGIIEKKISEGHAKVILSLDNPEKQRLLFDKIIREKLSVRESERVLKNAGYLEKKESDTEEKVLNFHKSSSREKKISDELSDYFGARVKVKIKSTGNGEINISFHSQDELNEILNKFDFVEQDW